jgi:alpha-tubulin suppressor-like RCC1 family protein
MGQSSSKPPSPPTSNSRSLRSSKFCGKCHQSPKKCKCREPQFADNDIGSDADWEWMKPPPSQHLIPFQRELAELFNEQQLIPILFSYYDNPYDSPPCISIGHSHSLFLRRGELYSWGDNNYRQLGRQVDDTQPANRPGLVVLPARARCWIAISIGYAFSLALTDTGQLYSWGRNDEGQLGRAVDVFCPLDHPGLVGMPPGATHWTTIATKTGVFHGLATTNTGELYSWGDNYQGKLSRRVTPANPADRPGLVGMPPGARFWIVIAIGRLHSLAIIDTGQLYSWGRNDETHLGRVVNAVHPADRPGLITLPPGAKRWITISAGSGFSLAITNTGQLYSWGRNDEGQLGRRGERCTPCKPTGTCSFATWSKTLDYHFNRNFA